MSLSRICKSPQSPNNTTLYLNSVSLIQSCHDNVGFFFVLHLFVLAWVICTFVTRVRFFHCHSIMKLHLALPLLLCLINLPSEKTVKSPSDCHYPWLGLCPRKDVWLYVNPNVAPNCVQVLWCDTLSFDFVSFSFLKCLFLIYCSFVRVSGSALSQAL